MMPVYTNMCAVTMNFILYLKYKWGKEQNGITIQ